MTETNPIEFHDELPDETSEAPSPAADVDLTLDTDSPATDQLAVDTEVDNAVTENEANKDVPAGQEPAEADINMDTPEVTDEPVVVGEGAGGEAGAAEGDGESADGVAVPAGTDEEAPTADASDAGPSVEDDLEAEAGEEDLRPLNKKLAKLQEIRERKLIADHDSLESRLDTDGVEYA